MLHALAQKSPYTIKYEYFFLLKPFQHQSVKIGSKAFYCKHHPQKHNKREPFSWVSLIFYVNFLFFSDAFSVLVVFFKKATKKLLLLQNNMKFIEIRAHGVVCHDFLGFFWHYYVPHCEFCNSSKQRQRAVIAPKIRLTCLHCITIAPTKLLSALV